jgi:magnesium transporter
MIYLIGAGGALTGMVPLARILLAEGNTPLRELSTDEVTSVEAHTDQKTVINLFHKYNLVELPVVDDKTRLLGIVTADDVLEVVVNRR